jgi:hypothetical protein
MLRMYVSLYSSKGNEHSETLKAIFVFQDRTKKRRQVSLYYGGIFACNI